MGIVLLCMLGCGRPPAKLVISGDTARVSVETLGEYPTTITRARLQDESNHTVVWEVETGSGTPQIHQVVLKGGLNSASGLDPETGSYKIVVPQGSETFELQSSRPYKLELWSEATGSPARVEITFPN
jgi:hypothetical protein